MTEIYPKVFQGLKPDIDLIGFIGTTEVMSEKTIQIGVLVIPPIAQKDARWMGHSFIQPRVGNAGG